MALEPDQTVVGEQPSLKTVEGDEQAEPSLEPSETTFQSGPSHEIKKDPFADNSTTSDVNEKSQDLKEVVEEPSFKKQESCQPVLYRVRLMECMSEVFVRVFSFNTPVRLISEHF